VNWTPLLRTLGRAALGTRLPIVAGTLEVAGLERPVTIRRDRWGVPHITAETTLDAWFALGLCEAQDRGFQLETLLRVGRGTLAALVGPPGLPLDRLSRRLGFHRVARALVPTSDADLVARSAAFAAGINAGFATAVRGRPHELALLGAHPTPWTVEDVFGVAAILGFGLNANWDSELARLQVLRLDGPAALAALDPSYATWQHVTTPSGAAFGDALDHLADELARFGELFGVGGASNNWAIAPRKTATGRPLLANDPHLPGTHPPHWYLAHLRTPTWSVAGAAIMGAPGFGCGHNGFAAWGATSGHVDLADLYVEELGPDGRSVRRGDAFVPCVVHREVIEIKGAAPVVEEVLETDRGPLLTPVLDGQHAALSLQSTWTRPQRSTGLLTAPEATSFEDFRARFEHWSSMSFNLAYADVTGRVGWVLVGQAPRRRKGLGLLPAPGWDPDVGWEPELVSGLDMPWAVDPPEGFLATANNAPAPAQAMGAAPSAPWPWLGADWLDGDRVTRIGEAIAAKDDWSVRDCQALQLDEQVLAWRSLRATVLAHLGPASEAAPPQAATDAATTGEDAATAAAAAQALALLEPWDGVATADSPAAAVYELWLAALTRAVVRAKAPRAYAWALGRSSIALVDHALLAIRRVNHVVRLVTREPAGWFERGWRAAVREAVREAIAQLQRDHGPDPRGWAWGQVRTLTLQHPLGERAPLDQLFCLGPIPFGGDSNTVSQASVPPLHPSDQPVAIASLRAVFDVGNWDACRVALPGGQSGNPWSPHWDDQLEPWRTNEGIPLLWSDAAIARDLAHELHLRPRA
jgi:penicillin amidase